MRGLTEGFVGLEGCSVVSRIRGLGQGLNDALNQIIVRVGNYDCVSLSCRCEKNDMSECSKSNCRSITHMRHPQIILKSHDDRLVPDSPFSSGRARLHIP